MTITFADLSFHLNFGAKIKEFVTYVMLELNIFVIYNLFHDMFDK